MCFRDIAVDLGLDPLTYVGHSGCRSGATIYAENCIFSLHFFFVYTFFLYTLFFCIGGTLLDLKRGGTLLEE